MFFRQEVCRLFKGLRNSAVLRTKAYNSLTKAGKLIVSREHDFGGHTWTKHHLEVFQWVLLSGQAAIILGTFSSPSVAYASTESSTNFSGLTKIEDGSVISNEHTSKWRIFTDKGRDYFLKGNIVQAEKLFVSALEEAKKGFGERDPYVASACNNLAEIFKVKRDFDEAEPLYVICWKQEAEIFKVKRDFDEAEPLYQEAINILEENYGINDIRVGAALHNLGQFYHGQRKLEKARVCYERALKIKRRVLGETHTEYADTMYRLGTVLHLEGKENFAEDLIVDSIEILEAAGQGESMSCVRRMQHLAQIYTKSNRFAEAETLQRKTLHILELSKGWKSLDTVVVAERLALALEAVGRLKEAEELLERCHDAWKNLLPHDNIQSATNMLYIARVKMLISNQQLKIDTSRATTELDKAQNLLQDSVRIASKLLVQFLEKKGGKKPIGISRNTGRDASSAATVLLQSLNALGSLEIMKQEFLGSKEHTSAEGAYRRCISTFREFGTGNSISDSPQVKAEYLACLRSLHHLISNGRTSASSEEKEIKAEIQRVEGEISQTGKT